MAANNELGTINDIPAIASLAKSNGIIFHTDAVQYFSKFKLNLTNIDAISVSLHKLTGPIGIGLLILSKQLLKKYKLQSLICGNQQAGLRGGTECAALISTCKPAIIHVFKDRMLKNKKLEKLREFIWQSLVNSYHGITYEDWLQFGPNKFEINENKLENKNLWLEIKKKKIIDPQVDEIKKFKAKSNELFLVRLSPKINSLPNTLLISFVSLKYKFCNGRLKKYLNSKNIDISIGSACNTDSSQSSHVIQALNASKMIKKGIIRISLSDDSELKEAKRFLLEIDKFLKNEKIIK